MPRNYGYYYGRSPDYKAASPHERVLVAIMRTGQDLDLARTQGWYRIPARSAPTPIEFGWLALYETRRFGHEGWSIRYWAPVREIHAVKRRELLPDEPHHPRTDEDYYRVGIGPLQRVPQPIISRRRRFVVFICTTVQRFRQAREINDLFCESPLEDTMWDALRREGIEAERQWYLKAGGETYCLDFALFCGQGQVNIECDGDTWHASPERAPLDNRRDNALTSEGWSVLRFSTAQITDDLERCIWMVRETASHCGGIASASGEMVWPDTGKGPERQLSLFDGANVGDES